MIILFQKLVAKRKAAQGDCSAGESFECVCEDKGCLSMLVDDRTTVRMRENDGVLLGASPHESGSWLMHLHVDLLVHPTLFNVLDSGIKYSRTSKVLPGVLLPPVHLHSKPGLSNLIYSFVWKRDKRSCFCQVLLCLGQSPQEPGDLAPPRGTYSAPLSLSAG